MTTFNLYQKNKYNYI